MPLLIPFILGAGGTGYFWWKSSTDDEDTPTLEKDLTNAAKYFAMAIVAVLVLRWAWKQTQTSNVTEQ
jgi:hypothetical protein